MNLSSSKMMWWSPTLHNVHCAKSLFQQRLHSLTLPNELVPEVKHLGLVLLAGDLHELRTLISTYDGCEHELSLIVDLVNEVLQDKLRIDVIAFEHPEHGRIVNALSIGLTGEKKQLVVGTQMELEVFHFNRDSRTLFNSEPEIECKSVFRRLSTALIAELTPPLKPAVSW
ncbi:MAG: hypothetical protein K2X77_06830 [Candidatus Obscuribacterales bacterium]|jgi:hypothetical protein|nr:hypothetical protein [Candidatus Obscuribacterales bacterium]